MPELTDIAADRDWTTQIALLAEINAAAPDHVCYGPVKSYDTGLLYLPAHVAAGRAGKLARLATDPRAAGLSTRAAKDFVRNAKAKI